MTAEQFWPEWLKGKGKYLAPKCLSEISCEFAEAYVAERLPENALEIEHLRNEGYRLDADGDKWINRAALAETRAESLAAQLAEKEREIAQIKKELHRVYETNTVNADLYKAAYERAEAVEQQLATANLAALQASSACQAEMQGRSTWMNRALAAEQRLQEAQAERDALKELLTDMELEHSAALRQREAELEQRWIAVGERLPECGTCLMVYVYDRKDERKVSWQDLATYSYHGGWSVGSPIEPDLVVTHWQPLPSPPKAQP